MATKRIYNMGTRATEFSKLIQSMTGTHQLWEIWADFVTMSACCISNSVDAENWVRRDDLYDKVAGKYEQDEIYNMSSLFGLVVLALEENPEQDFLGEMYMQLDLGSHWHGQFFTPYPVSSAMAKVGIDREILLKKFEFGTASFNDCACGGGAMLIAAANHVRKMLEGTPFNWQEKCLFVGQDLDGIAAKMCYIQLSLLGCAGYVKIGDTLRNPVASGDDDSDYWYTPMYFSDIWVLRRRFRALGRAIDEMTKGESAATAPECTETKQADTTGEKDGDTLQISFDDYGGDAYERTASTDDNSAAAENKP